MTKKFFMLLGVILGLSVLISCTYGKATSLEENWGKSYTLQKESQILNPEACSNDTPVIGIDGKTGEKVLDTYRGGSQKTTSSNIGTLTITK